MKWLALCALAACTTTDDRPQTLAYITETILAPNCAAAECHSATKRQNHYVFDTVENANLSLGAHLDDGTGTAGPLLDACTMPPCDARNEPLFKILTVGDAYGNWMPLDQPLENLDIAFMKNWYQNGADGFTP